MLELGQCQIMEDETNFVLEYPKPENITSEQNSYAKMFLIYTPKPKIKTSQFITVILQSLMFQVF